MVNYKNSNEHYVANYILYGELGGSEESLEAHLYHDSDLEYAVTAKEFKDMFYGAPVYVRFANIPVMHGVHCDAVVYEFIESDIEIGARTHVMDQEVLIVFPE